MQFNNYNNIIVYNRLNSNAAEKAYVVRKIQSPHGTARVCNRNKQAALEK
jgi:hypothetical protein